VFCDSGFIILSKLIHTLSVNSGTSSATIALSLSTGLYTSHSLIPPTPGPLSAAVNLGLGNNLGLVILVGMLFSIPVGVISYFASNKLGKKIKSETVNEQNFHSTLPLWKSLLPLLIPVTLISIGSFSKILGLPESLTGVLMVMGTPLFALLIGLVFSFLNINFKTEMGWPNWIAEALKDAGIILLITGVGGSFGGVIKDCGIEKIIHDAQTGSVWSESGILLFGFTVGAILKTAQGSTTSSMIITSSIVGPMAVALGLVSQIKLCLILMAIGGGAMTVSHANDSYFWVISRFAGISHSDILKSYTLTTLFQGLTVLAIALIVMSLV